MNQQILHYRELVKKRHPLDNIPSDKRELEKILEIAEDDIQRVLKAEPLSFEDIQLMALCRYPTVTFTADMRERHLSWYGEDWPKKRREDARQIGLMPAPVVLSAVAGQGGEVGWLDVKVSKGFNAKFYRPIFVEDTVETLCEIIELFPHRDNKREYGYVTLHQDIFNQHGDLAYDRDIIYAVFKRGMPSCS